MSKGNVYKETFRLQQTHEATRFILALEVEAQKRVAYVQDSQCHVTPCDH